MTNEEILKKAIEKALENDKELENQLDFDALYASLFEDSLKTLGGKNCYRLIFSHDFAKAFWKQKPKNKAADVCYSCGNIADEEHWMFHLQQMVLEKEPLKYLKKFL